MEMGTSDPGHCGTIFIDIHVFGEYSFNFTVAIVFEFIFIAINKNLIILMMVDGVRSKNRIPEE